LKQLQFSWLLYCEDNNDALPPNRPMSAHVQARDLMASASDSWVAGNAWTDTTTENLQRGVLFRYHNSPGVYRCPADKSTVCDQGKVSRTRSYSMSWFMNMWPNPADRYYSHDWHRLGDIRDPGPAQAFVFADEHENSTSWGLFAVHHPSGVWVQPGTTVWTWLSFPSTRHGNAGTISFADGHAETWRWKEPTTLKPKSANPWPDFRPTVPGDRDLSRFHRAIPAKVPIP
jgi:prepilin-type processing-associated H-X9-DG protein